MQVGTHFTVSDPEPIRNHMPQECLPILVELFKDKTTAYTYTHRYTEASRCLHMQKHYTLCNG